MDAVGSNIRIDARASEVLRILPRLNEDVNEEWISDKTRFACDGLRRQRLDRPYVREGGKLRPARWSEAFAAIAGGCDGLAGERIAAIAGDLACCESMLLLKELMGSLGSPNIDCRQDGAALPAAPRSAYLFNTTIAGIEQADALPADRHQPAAGSGGAQRPHPQALAMRPNLPDRPARASGRS